MPSLQGKRPPAPSGPAVAPDIPASSKLVGEAAPGTGCALQATTATTSAAALYTFKAGSVVVMLDTRVAHALYRNYVTVYVGGDGRGPVEHLQLTLQSLWRSEGPIEVWVVLNVRHQ